MKEKRSTLASSVVDKITDYIQANQLNPGDRIPSEMELVSLFNVGRGTIREAVKQLVAINVLTIVPAKGTFVAENSHLVDDPLGFETIPDKKKLLKDLTELRILLDGYAASSAALNADEQQIAYLKEILTEIDEHVDDNEFCLAADIRFHKAIAECSGNVALPLLSPVFHSNFFHFLSVPIVREWESMNKAHWAIVHAIEKRNPELARAELVRHLCEFIELLEGSSL